jgi:transcriptional regulator with XRE-family HTH domain
MSAVLPNEVLYFNMNHPLGRWRYRHNVSQEDLGRRCQLSQKTISAYETGTRVPRGDALKRLQEVTGLPLEALLFPEDFLQTHADFLVEPPRERRRGRPRKQSPGEG